MWVLLLGVEEQCKAKRTTTVVPTVTTLPKRNSLPNRASVLSAIVGNSSTNQSKMKVEIIKDDIVDRKTDSRGRITLGSEYANKHVEVAILDGE